MLTFALTVVAGVFAGLWWRSRDQVARLRAITDPDRSVCGCGHDDWTHWSYAGGCRHEWVGLSGCPCGLSRAEVQAAARARRTHMTRIDVQDT